jgi:hypothetical protein
MHVHASVQDRGLNLGADKRYVLSEKFSGEASVMSAALPGLPLTLRQIFAS